MLQRTGEFNERLPDKAPMTLVIVRIIKECRFEDVQRQHGPTAGQGFGQWCVIPQAKIAFEPDDGSGHGVGIGPKGLSSGSPVAPSRIVQVSSRNARNAMR